MAIWAGADPDDVDDVSSLPEPHGPDGAMADRGGTRVEISQSGATGHLRQAVRTARRRAGPDLASPPPLYPAGLRHRHGDGGQPAASGDRGSRLHHAVRVIAA